MFAEGDAGDAEDAGDAGDARMQENRRNRAQAVSGEAVTIQEWLYAVGGHGSMVNSLSSFPPVPSQLTIAWP